MILFLLEIVSSQLATQLRPLRLVGFAIEFRHLADGQRETGLLMLGACPASIRQDRLVNLTSQSRRPLQAHPAQARGGTGSVIIVAIVATMAHPARRREDFRPSERVAIAAAVAKEVGNRQGQRTELSHDGDEVLKGRTDDEAAKPGQSYQTARYGRGQVGDAATRAAIRSDRRIN